MAEKMRSSVGPVVGKLLDGFDGERVTGTVAVGVEEDGVLFEELVEGLLSLLLYWLAGEVGSVVVAGAWPPLLLELLLELLEPLLLD